MLTSVFAVCAVVGGTLYLCQFLLSLLSINHHGLFGSHHGHHGGHGRTIAGHHGSAGGMRHGGGAPHGHHGGGVHHGAAPAHHHTAPARNQPNPGSTSISRTAHPMHTS